MKTSDLLIALLSIVLWSSNIVVLKIGLVTTSVETFNLVRFGLCLPLLFFVKKPNMSLIHLCFIALFFNVLNFWFGCSSIRHGTSIGVAAFLFQTGVFFGMFFSYIFNKDIPTGVQIMGCGVALLGVLVLSYPSMSVDKSLVGIVEALLSAVSWGTGFALLKKYKVTNDPGLVVWTTCLSFFILFALDTLFGGHGIRGIMQLSIPGFSGALYALLFATLLGCSLWFRLIQKYDAVLLGSFIFLMPVFSIIFSYIIFLETVSYLQLLGGLVIIIGLIISHLKLGTLKMRLNQHG